MIELIVRISDLTRQDAYSLRSLAADLGIIPLVDVSKGIHCVIPHD